MFCCMLLYVHSSIAIILMGKRELVALLNLSSWCLVMVLAVPLGCLPFVIVVSPDHTHLLFLGHFGGFKILNFNIFEGFQKKEYYLGVKILGIFWGSSQNWTIFRGHFYAF